MQETRFHYVSLDSDHDLGDTILEVTLDQETWHLAEHTDAPPAAASIPTPPAGLDRYWWRVLLGPGQDLDPSGLAEPVTLYGRLSDTPEQMFPSWLLGDTDTDAPPAFPDRCWPVIIPDECAAAFAGYSAATRYRAETAAVTTLRMLTAGQVGGGPAVYHATRAGCLAGSGPTWRTYEVAGGSLSGHGFYPVLASGTWLNIGCGACGACGYPADLRLPEPVGTVEEVTVNGAVLPRTSYVVRDNLLRRTDGEAWPATGTTVRYTRGRPVDGMGAIAAGLLACEFAKAISGKGGKCALPDNVQVLARAGVTFGKKDSPALDLWTGGTGIREVDLWVSSINPHRLRTAPVVWSPDLPAGR